MTTPFTIDSDGEKSCFILTGDISGILKNRRLIFSLKRLNFAKENEKIFIPYEKKTQIKVLKELQKLFLKSSHHI